MYSKQSIDNLENIFQDMKSEFTTHHTIREVYRDIDKALQKESDHSEERMKGDQARRAGKKDKVSNIEIAITQQYKEAAEAHLVGTFLAGDPIFAAVSNRKNEDAASMLTALTKRDQHRLNWVGELSRCLDDVLRYNVCAAEVNWGSRTAINAATKVEEGSAETGKFKAVVYEGNVINRCDPYNLVYDLDVEPNKVHIDGSYVGYFDLLNYIGLKREFEKWNDLYIIKQNIKKAFESNKSNNYYYRPVIRPEKNIDNPANNWSHYWGFHTTHNMAGLNGEYEKLTLYKRIIPKEYDVNIPHKGSPQVFKLIWINGHLIYAEPVKAGHEYLPIVVGQVYPGQNSTKSFVEYLMPLQDLATSSMSATLNSMRRAVLDRALYNPNRIRKGDIEGDSPVSKIPVTGNTYDPDFRGSYYQIPYNDNISGLFGQTLQTVFSLADNETGINRASQGNFVRGNKTMFEFDTIMSNSEARMQLGAMRLSQSFFAPMKEIIKLNYLVYAHNETIENDSTDEQIQIDPVRLRKIAPEFAMADGIMPSTKIANTEVLMQAAQMFVQNPTAFMNYDIEGMLVSVIKQQGLHDVDSYKRTPEQQQQFMQQMAMMQGGGAAPPTQEGGGQQTQTQQPSPGAQR